MKEIKEPKILSKNTYFSLPMGSASESRRYEKLLLNEVENYFVSLGFSTRRDFTSIIGEREYQGVEVSVSFTYRESRKNVYKSLSVYFGDEKKDIRLIRKIAKSITDGDI